VAANELSDEEVLARFPEERVTRDDVDFYRGLLLGELRAKRCLDCGRWHLPQRAYCPACWSPRVASQALCGRGTLHLLMFLHQGPPLPGVDYARGHPVATVELDEQPGLRFTATLVDCAREQMQIGLRVAFCTTSRGHRCVPAFRPAPGSGA
jgi:hypothetical protein